MGPNWPGCAAGKVAAGREITLGGEEAEEERNKDWDNNQLAY